MFYGIGSAERPAVPVLHGFSVTPARSRAGLRHEELRMFTWAFRECSATEYWFSLEYWRNPLLLSKQLPFETPTSCNERSNWGGGQKGARAEDIPDLNTESLHTTDFHSHTCACSHEFS